MKRIRILRTFMFVFLLGTIVSFASSCSDDDESAKVDYGTVSGIVTDLDGNPIEGVAVTISDTEGSATTGADGKYTFSNVSMEKHAVIFTKMGYQTISATVLADKFDGNKVATIDISMTDASSKITGTITDAKNGGAPLADVTVSISTTISTTSGSDGTYALEYLATDDYTVTFVKEGYVTITRSINKSDFVDGVATLDIRMGGAELLRGLTADDLEYADKWYYNEYRGGGNAPVYPHWDWACDYMCALTFWGNWEEQWEGTSLRIRNDGDQQNNPADMDVFDSYMYGSKKITVDNKILSLRVRSHNADDASPTYFGVQVVDLSAANPVAEKVGETRTHGSEVYGDYHFDLSAYVGKEVIVAIGVYRKETGDYWKQLPIARIAFAQQNVTGWDWIPGADVPGLENWRLTQEMVRSTMPHTKSSFTGISPISAGRDVNMQTGYPAAYRAWRDIAHVGYEWSFMPLYKDPEVFPSEGYLLKTRGNGAINTEVPEAYFYAKFAIASGNNQLTFKTRNFGSNYTYFKITAIEEDATVTHLQPVSNTAQEAIAAENGCWKFKHGNGGKDDPAGYASFVYDLSQFNGRNVLLVIGVYNGEMNGDENKLVFYNIDLN